MNEDRYKQEVAARRNIMVGDMAADLVHSGKLSRGDLKELLKMNPRDRTIVITEAYRKAQFLRNVLRAAEFEFDETSQKIIEGAKYNIAVCVPHMSEQTKTQWENLMAKANLQQVEGHPDANVYTHSLIGMSIADARNTFVEMAQGWRDGLITHILFIDDDVVPETSTYLLDLFNHQKEVIGGLYYKKLKNPKQKISACLKLKDGRASHVGSQEKGILPAHTVATGLCLIDIKVFDKLEPPYFKTVVTGQGNKIIDDDAYFSAKCKDAGIELWVDPTIKADHIRR